MKHVETQWQIKRQNLMRQGVRCAKEFALAIQLIIEAIGIDNDKQLRLITFFLLLLIALFIQLCWSTSCLLYTSPSPRD